MTQDNSNGLLNSINKRLDEEPARIAEAKNTIISLSIIM
jgi:hypothetical protein